LARQWRRGADGAAKGGTSMSDFSLNLTED
jgi:hypothetical protein